MTRRIPTRKVTDTAKIISVFTEYLAILLIVKDFFIDELFSVFQAFQVDILDKNDIPQVIKF